MCRIFELLIMADKTPNDSLVITENTLFVYFVY